MRMLRRLSILATALVVVGSVQAAPALDREMREVEQLRGLTFIHGVKERTIDRKQLRPLIREQLSQEIPYSIDDYVRILKALQLIDDATPDVVDKMLDLYDSQVLAFYDPATHTYFAIRQLPNALAGVSDSSALRESVVLHELTHALQDQRFNATARDKALQHDTDGELAYHALLEGEATLVMLDYLLTKSGQSFEDAVKSDLLMGMSAAASDQSIAPDAPKYFVESLKFPYIDGLKLVVQAYRRGGWKEIDKLHSNPPRTTREVLHPDEYFARLASGQKGAEPFDPARPKDVLTVERLGEFHWRYLVGDRAQGWLDDRVTVMRDGSVTADTRWETPEKAAAFRDAYVAFLRGRGIDPQVTTDGSAVKILYHS
jgi:hypothetical protein